MYDISYCRIMKCTLEFSSWINKLDRSLQIRIDQRIQRLADGNPGLHRRFDNILEIKWKTGTMGSFRLYCIEHDGYILLLGGHKDTQSKDIEFAKQLLEGVKNGKVRIEDYE
jgi:putative addiction module killer protein